MWNLLSLNCFFECSINWVELDSSVRELRVECGYIALAAALEVGFFDLSDLESRVNVLLIAHSSNNKISYLSNKIADQLLLFYEGLPKLSNLIVY